MTRWLANAHAACGLLATAWVCSACAGIPVRSDTGVESRRSTFAEASNRAYEPERVTSPVPRSTRSNSSAAAKQGAPQAESADSGSATSDTTEEEPAASAAPVLRVGASCALRSLDVQVTDQGGLALEYTAENGFVERLRTEIRHLVRRHNARSTRLLRAPLQGYFETALTVVAIPSDEPHGIRVVLVPPTPDSLPDLFANTELYAPDLLPDPEWQANRRQRCGA